MLRRLLGCLLEGHRSLVQEELSVDGGWREPWHLLLPRRPESSPHSELLSPRGPSRLPASRAGTTFSSQHTPADPHQVPSSWVTLLITYQVVLKATVFPQCC